MKHAYAQYNTNALRVHNEKVGRLVERAHIYNVPFLQNTTRVEEIFALFLDEPKELINEVEIKKLPKVWEWLKHTEQKACMS